MKFRGHITAVARNGGLLKVTMVACAAREPEGTWLREVTIEVPWSQHVSATYRVDRDVTLTLELT